MHAAPSRLGHVEDQRGPDRARKRQEVRSRSRETAKEVREEIGGEVRTLQLDLTAPDTLERVKQATEGLEVALLLYNAGAAHGAAPFLEQPLERSLSLIGLNPTRQVSVAYRFGQGMVTRGRGGIVFISSAAGAVGSGGVVAYCTFKASKQVLAEVL